jgi:hypothetical protein
MNHPILQATHLQVDFLAHRQMDLYTHEHQANGIEGEFVQTKH